MSEEEVKNKMLAGINNLIPAMNETLEEITGIDEAIGIIKSSISDKKFCNKKIDNIAITYNNKLVEIFQFYKKNNVSLDESCLKYLFLNYLVEILGKAIECTDRYSLYVQKIFEYVSRINKKNVLFRKIYISKNKEFLEQLIDEVSEVLNEYCAYDNQIFKFDLAKDALKLYEDQQELFEKIESEVSKDGQKDVFLQNCNKELKDLGIKTVFVKKEESIEDLPTYDELINRMYNDINKVEDKYEKYPITSWIILSHISDNFELLKQASDNKNNRLYREISNRITSFDYLNLSKYIVDMVGETLSFYGISRSELNMLRKELSKLGFKDKISEIEGNIMAGKYEEYGKLQTLLLESSPTKKILLPNIEKSENKKVQN